MVVSRILNITLPVAVTALLAGSVAIAAPAAAEIDELDCSGKNDLLIKPGLGTTAAAAPTTYQSATAGTLDCVGVINGKKITGPGQYARVGEFTKGSTCNVGGGKGLLRMVLPTESGPLQIDAPFTFSYPDRIAPGAIGAKIDFENEEYGGKFDIIATNGDCVQTPVTGARFVDTLYFES